MNQKKEQKAKDWREARRLRAWELRAEGWSQAGIAKALGVTTGAVSQWFKRGDTKEAMRSCKPAGHRPQLREEQRQQLAVLLAEGAPAYGFRGEVWTRKRVVWLIKKHFGVEYTPQHVGRLLRKIGWSRQKPLKRASQRNDEAIEQWRTEKWPQIKKKHKRSNEP
jgi:transposase